MSRTRTMRIIDLYNRSERRPGSTCWHWLGAKSGGSVRIWTLDFDRAEKRTMSGPKAVWNIAKQRGTGDRLAFMTCVNMLCVNPDHVSSAPDKAAIGAHIRAVGARVGTAVESRRANIARAHVANGITVTPPDVVRAIRAAPAAMTNIAIAAQHGILHHQTVSRIRRRLSRRDVIDERAAA